jgi:hypothetical protein
MAIAYLGTLPGIGVTGVRRWAIFCGLAAFRIVNHVGLPPMKGGVVEPRFSVISGGGFILFSGAFVFLPARRFVELPSRRPPELVGLVAQKNRSSRHAACEEELETRNAELRLDVARNGVAIPV